MKGLIKLLSIFMLGVVVSAWANEVVEFDTQQQRQRYNTLIEELRCPKCQNQNLEDSNAGIAVDLRHQVYTMITAGQSDDEIVDYMVARYGEFVLYRPVQDRSTAILWYGPFALLLFGAVIFALVVLRNKRSAKEEGMKP